MAAWMYRHMYYALVTSKRPYDAKIFIFNKKKTEHAEHQSLFFLNLVNAIRWVLVPNYKIITFNIAG